MLLNVLPYLAGFAASIPSVVSVPVDGTTLAPRGQIPGDIHTTACKYYSNFVGVWTYEARIREPDMTPDDLCPKLESDGKENLMCGLMTIKDCSRDVNDPQVKKWTFEVRSQCTADMVASAIKKATGQGSVDCGIVFNPDEWP